MTDLAVDYSTPIGKVRGYIPDVELLDDPAVPSAAPEYLFHDAHLQMFLDQNGGSVRLAAADACEVLGTSEALVSKVITTEDLVTDGSKVMQQFLARAKQLRDTAASLDSDDVDGFAVVPYFLPWHRRCAPEGSAPYVCEVPSAWL